MSGARGGYVPHGSSGPVGVQVPTCPELPWGIYLSDLSGAALGYISTPRSGQKSSSFVNQNKGPARTGRCKYTDLSGAAVG